MTINTTTNFAVFKGNGVVRRYTLPFPVQDESHLARVTIRDGSSDTILREGDDYRIDDVGTGQNATLVLMGPVPDGQTLIVERVVPLTQETAISNQSGFYPKVQEDALDKLTMITQQIDARNQRSLQVDLDTEAILPFRVRRADREHKVLAFNGDGSRVTTTLSVDGFENLQEKTREYAERAEAAAALTSGDIVPEIGDVATISGVFYQYTGANVIPDLPGWEPIGIPQPEHFGTRDNWAQAIGRARANLNRNQPLMLLNGGQEGYLGNTTNNFYGSYRDALGLHLTVGTQNAPVFRAEPVVWVEKVTATHRGDNPREWDQGAIYAALRKESGNSYGAALTGYADIAGGNGDLIGMHARVARRTSVGRGYASWHYFDGIVPSTDPGHAMEVNARVTYDPGYGSGHQLVRLCMADNSTNNQNRFGSALTIGRNTTGGDNNGFHTGIRIESNAIIRTGDSNGDGEAMRIDAAESAAGNVGGIRFAKLSAGHQGVFKYALKTDEATFSSNHVMRLGVNQRITWFDGSTQGISFIGGANVATITGGALNINDGTLRINGQQVLGPRRIGWETPIGTGSRTSFNTATVTLEQLARKVKALIDDGVATGWIG